MLIYREREVLAWVNMWVICKTSVRNKNEKGNIEIVGDVVDGSVSLLHEPTHNANCIFLNPLLFKLCMSWTMVSEIFRF